MTEPRSYFEQAVDALERAMSATDFGQQAAALEEALRLNRRSLAEERAKLDKLASDIPSALDPAHL